MQSPFRRQPVTAFSALGRFAATVEAGLQRLGAAPDFVEGEPVVLIVGFHQGQTAAEVVRAILRLREARRD
jgi:hypothetical protein